MDHRYRKFLAVAETGSFSLAAKRLHVTQPAVTLAVASLERALGAKLCIRKKHIVELTAHGNVVAKAASKIAQTIEKMEQELSNDAAYGKYRVGIIDSIAHLLYGSEAAKALLQDSSVHVDNSRRILDDLIAEKLDIGVITGQPNSLGRDVAVRKLHEEEFVFVRSPHAARLATVGEIPDWLAINPDSTSYQYFVRLFKQEGLLVTPIFYSTSMELLKDMALAGKGTALLPWHIVRESVRRGELAILETKRLYRPLWAVTRTNRDSSMLELFARQIDELLGAGTAVQK